MAQREPTRVTPFWVRIATEASLSPGWLLIAIPGVLYPTYLALEALFGRGLAAATDIEGDYEARVLLSVVVGLGYLSMMCTYVARGTSRDLEALRPVLREGNAAYAGLREHLTRFDRRHLWIGALGGLVIFSVLQETSFSRWTRLVAGEWSFRDPCSVVIFMALWTVGGRMAAYLIDTSRLYSRIGERQIKVDLLDLGSVSHLTRHGLRIVLLFTICTAVAVIFFTLFVQSVATVFTVGMMVTSFCTLAVATAAFVLPVRGLRRQIRARKAEKLAQLRDEIRHNEELMAGSGTQAAEAGAKMPGLLAYMNQIESVREWPFDAPTLTRFFLYVAIPLGSWVGGALVERLLGAALD
jgi:hypothetical protein